MESANTIFHYIGIILAPILLDLIGVGGSITEIVDTIVLIGQALVLAEQCVIRNQKSKKWRGIPLIIIVVSLF